MVSEGTDAKGVAGLGLALLGLCFGTGCATYSDRMAVAHSSAAAGDYARSIDAVDGVIDVNDSEALPDDFDSSKALAVLERATLKQAAGEYRSSSQDFEAADKQLEILDLSNDAVGTLGKYLYSDSANKYYASPVEKLALNSFNMMNYLTGGDLRGARVEARRFTVMRSFLRDLERDVAHGALGSYLAGFTMEQLDEYTPALRYYDEALQERNLKSLAGPAHRLAKRSAYRGAHLESFLAATAPPGPLGPGQGELIVLVNVGRVPYKVPERIPVGAAVGVAGSWISGNPNVLGYSVLKVVVYPELVDTPSLSASPELQIDGSEASLELLSDLGAEIRREYEAMKPQIMGAAISRLVVRAAAAEAVRAGGNAQSSALGWILALAVEGSMVAMDRPDTRSWTFLPARVLVHRAIVDSGTHQIRVKLTGGPNGIATRQVDVEAGGFGAVVVTSPR